MHKLNKKIFLKRANKGRSLSVNGVSGRDPPHSILHNKDFYYKIFFSCPIAPPPKKIQALKVADFKLEDGYKWGLVAYYSSTNKLFVKIFIYFESAFEAEQTKNCGDWAQKIFYFFRKFALRSYVFPIEILGGVVKNFLFGEI